LGCCRFYEDLFSGIATTTSAARNNSLAERYYAIPRQTSIVQFSDN